MLRHLLPHVPNGIFGSIPSRSSTDLAFLLQSSIEDALQNNVALVGCSMDLSKAFNVVFRPVLSRLAQRLGWPKEVVQLYMNFLDAVQRYWSLGDGMYGPVHSSSGVPEGDPVSVVAMILVTMFVAEDLQQTQNVELQPFVDNWSLQTPCPIAAVKGGPASYRYHRTHRNGDGHG